MSTYKITLSNQWKYTEKGYFEAASHLEAINKVNNSVTRIYNKRFREIEQSGIFYFVEDISKNGKTFIFECL